MSSHDDPIGQQWTDASLRDSSFVDFMALVLGNELANDFAVLAAVNARDPRLVRECILGVAHARGRHADRGCPERCPRF
jgi:hypothetical protein